ncbi:MAG: exodeoxyribonuclease VII small subunit [Frankia sp.]|nr:exodeoxyribonuclease VII small subunit [Frankia sp.]
MTEPTAPAQAPATPAPPAGQPPAGQGHAPPAGQGHAPPAGQSYEAARAELEEVVRRLEAGGVTLEESLALWERGEELAGICQALLDGARARIAAARPAQPQESAVADQRRP